MEVSCSNPVLLPDAGLSLSGSGASRSLNIVPAAIHSGSAQVTIRATDGNRSVSSTFAVTVTPRQDGLDPRLILTDATNNPPQTFRFRIVDLGTGSTNYLVEYRAGVHSTNTWVTASNVVVSQLGAGVFQVDSLPPPGTAGFYRAKGFQLILATLDSSAHAGTEGSSASGPVVVFNGVYTGMVTCIWTDEEGTTWTNRVQVNGTTASIPPPASSWSDNGSINELRQFSLELEAGQGFALGAIAESKMVLDENDGEWHGVLLAAGCNIDFGLTIIATNSFRQGWLQSRGFGFFPTNVLAQLNHARDVFTAVATNVPLPTLVAYPSLAFTNYLDFRLEASNTPGQTNVTPSRISGSVTLVNRVANARHLDAVASGTFTLMKEPTAPATNDVPLLPVP
jgi:hypothetical protein